MSISVLQQSRRHSSFLISPSDHSEFHIGVVSQPGTCDRASGHWEPSESASQEHLEPLVVVSTADCCCCALRCVGDGIDIELLKLWHAEKYSSGAGVDRGYGITGKCRGSGIVSIYVRHSQQADNGVENVQRRAYPRHLMPRMCAEFKE